MPSDHAGDVAPYDNAAPRSLPLADDDEREANWPARQSRGTRVLLGAFLGIAVLVLLGVVAVVVFATEFGESTTTNPSRVATVLEGIAGIETPEGFEPEMAVTVKVLPWRRPVMAWAKYSDKQTDSTLVVGQLGKDANINDPKFFPDFMRQIEQSLDGHHAKHKGIAQARPSAWDVEAGDRTITCQRATGVDPDSGAPMFRIKTVFLGRHGPAGLVLYADATRYNEETILKTLQSIRGGLPVRTH